MNLARLAPACFRVPPRPKIWGEFGNSRCEALRAGSGQAQLGCWNSGMLKYWVQARPLVLQFTDSYYMLLGG